MFVSNSREATMSRVICEHVSLCSWFMSHLTFAVDPVGDGGDPGVGEMAQWVKCLLSKHKDPSSDPRGPHRTLGAALFRT